MSKLPLPQRGFAAIAAVFLVVTLAALGAFMVTFSNTAQVTSAQDLQGTRAYWAARGGMAWGLTQINAAAVTPCVTGSSATSFSLDGFALTVTTSRACYSESGGASNVSIYQVLSVTSSGTAGTLGFVERSVAATFEK